MELATAIERVEKGPLLAADKAMAIASISATLDQTSTAISKAQVVRTRAFTIELQPCCDQIIKLAKCLDTWIAMCLVLRAARPCCFSGPPTPFWSGPLEPVRPTNIAGPLVFTVPPRKCTDIANYFTALEWVTITTKNPDAPFLVVRRVADLGFKHPSEKSFASMAAVLSFPNCLSIQEMLKLVRNLKMQFKSCVSAV